MRVATDEHEPDSLPFRPDAQQKSNVSMNSDCEKDMA